MASQLTVYVRSGCHLCDDMLALLTDYRDKRDFDLEVIDILGNPELERNYGSKIPVLAAGSNEICHYYLDLQALTQYIDKA